jgi:dUTP pyrophosphatase
MLQSMNVISSKRMRSVFIPYWDYKGVSVLLKVKRVGPNAGAAIIPRYQKSGDSGMDLHAAEYSIIPSGGWAFVSTGLAFEIPPGYEGQVRSRSGLAGRLGLIVLNSPGTIDSGYRGELKIILMNIGVEPVSVVVGDRVAQLVICPVVSADVVEVDELSDSERGESGFGSTGTDKVGV